MASNVKQQFLVNMHGGAVDSVPPDALQENQMRECNNLVPMESNTQLSLRQGIDRLYDAGRSIGSPRMLGIFEKVLPSGTPKIYHARKYGTTSADTALFAWNGSTSTAIKIFSGTASTTERYTFSDWDGSIFFFSDGVSGVYKVDASTDTVTQVIDVHNQTSVYPTSQTVTVGTGLGGVGNLDGIDNVLVSITEAAATPGMDYQVKIPASTTTHKKHVHVVGYYSGSPSHYITVQAWDGAGWDEIGRMANLTAVETYQFGLDTSHFIGGEVTLRFYHSMAGIATHKLHLDAVWMTTIGTNIEAFTHMLQHRGRIWGVRGESVWFCGTDDATDGDQPRYYNWSPSTVDGVTFDDGNYMNIPPFGSNVVGLASVSSGLLILKEKSIHIWTYPDSAAPYEVEKGAAIDTIASNIGCVSPDSISYDGDMVYFIGQDESERLGLYRINGNEVGQVETKQRAYMRSIRANTFIGGEILGKRYYFFTDAGMTMMYDIVLDAWYPMSSAEFETLSHGNYSNTILLGGADGYMWSYPSSVHADNGAGIPWSIRTRDFVDGAFDEMKTREVYAEAGAVSSSRVTSRLYRDENLAKSYSFDIGSSTPDIWLSNDVFNEYHFINYSDYWDDGDTWGGEPPVIRKGIPVSYRGYRFSLELAGIFDQQVVVNKLGIGYRGRQGKTYVY